MIQTMSTSNTSAIYMMQMADYQNSQAIYSNLMGSCNSLGGSTTAITSTSGQALSASGINQYMTTDPSAYMDYMNGSANSLTSSTSTQSTATDTTATTTTTSSTSSTGFDYTNLSSNLKNDYSGTVKSYLMSVLGMDEASASSMASSYAESAQEMMQIFGSSYSSGSGSSISNLSSSLSSDYEGTIKQMLMDNFGMDEESATTMAQSYAKDYSSLTAAMSAASSAATSGTTSTSATSSSSTNKGVSALLADANSMVGLNENTDTAAINKITKQSGINCSTTPWCAAWAMNMLSNHGTLDTSSCSNVNYCPTIKNWAQDQGIWKSSSSGYTPQAGDAILFDWNSDGKMDHVGIVEKVANGKVYTIEGNSSDSVAKRSYSLSSSNVAGYVACAEQKK